MRIVIATGGSGGHIFPAISVAKELAKGAHEIIFLGPLKEAGKKIKSNGFDVKCIDSLGLSVKSIMRFVTALTYMSRAIVESYRYLKRFRPDIVVGFGGYGAFAPVFAAVMLRYPTLIHEQNVIPGRANNLLSKLVDKIAISFKESELYFNKEKVVFTGCPSHLESCGKPRQELLTKFNLKENLPVVLVLGGSQGSHRINEEFLKAAKLLRQEIEFQVIHLAGQSDYEQVRAKYGNLNVCHYLVDFLDEIEEAYAIADLAISRAGAVTISELGFFGVPSILIPYPYAGGHQRENAKVLARDSGARVLHEDELSGQKLKDEIFLFLEKFKDEGETAKPMNPIYLVDAKQCLADKILELKK